MTNQCEHGQLARVCEICELRAELKESRKQAFLDAAEIADGFISIAIAQDCAAVAGMIPNELRRKAEEL